MLEIATTEDEIRKCVLRAIASWSVSDFEGLYAISFLIEPPPDDTSRLALYLSYNTISQWRSRVGGTAAEDEVKWNFAFWLQNISLIVTYPDSGGAINDDRQFVHACVAVAKSIQEYRLLVTIIGKMIPIIIHTLEYSLEDLEHTKRANPPDLIAEFVAYEP